MSKNPKTKRVAPSDTTSLPTTEAVRVEKPEYLNNIIIEPTATGEVAVINTNTFDALDVDIRVRRDDPRVLELAGSIDIGSTGSIVNFGAPVQTAIGKVAEQLLSEENVRQRDVGSEVGDSLNSMLDATSSINFKSLKNSDTLLAKMLRFITLNFYNPVKQFKRQWDTVEGQVGQIEGQLAQHETKLQRNLVVYDRLFDEVQTLYGELEYYIVAIDLAREKMMNEVIPAQAAKVQALKDSGNEYGLEAQELQDLESKYDQLDRQHTALQFSRTIAAQDLPSFRASQSIDYGLIEKIRQAINIAIPLWKRKLVQLTLIKRTSDAAKYVEKFDQHTAKLMVEASLQQRESSVAAAKVLNDFEVLVSAAEDANNNVIGMITDLRTIARDSRAKRIEVNRRMEDCRDAMYKAVADDLDDKTIHSMKARISEGVQTSGRPKKTLSFS